ncbi:MAG: AAA family ATPase, partial [Candidatus Dormibacteraceae bacterium]
MGKLTSMPLSDFYGREWELRLLQSELDDLVGDIQTAARGRCLLLRGRRRVGKSRLTQAFCSGSKVPYAFFAATGAGLLEDLAEFHAAVGKSSLPDARTMALAQPTSWLNSLEILSNLLPDDRPTILVMDEVPFVMREDQSFEGALQLIWDRSLEAKPLLLILVGSDISMMERLNDSRRPFHRRGKNMFIQPLNPAEVAAMVGLEGADALDAYLITGGMPLICRDWRRGEPLSSFLQRSLVNPISALCGFGQETVGGEYPAERNTSRVLRHIGSGERTLSNISHSMSDVSQMTILRALEALTRRGAVTADLPLSTKASRDRRYRIADSYLLFWLQFVERNLTMIERG